MSQIYKPLESSGPIPPNIPTSFVTDIGTVIPATNVVNINGGYTITNNTNGIQVIANPNLSNNEVVQLTNRFQVSGTINNTTPTTIYTLNLGAVPAMYLFNWSMVILDKTSSLGSAYQVLVPLRTNGAAAIGTVSQDFYEAEEGALIGLTVSSGPTGNSFFVSITGFNTDTLDYNLTGTYLVVT